MIVLSRVDSRLVHGQVIEAWLPHTKAERIVVVDDASANDSIARAAMGLALPDHVKLKIERVGEVDFGALSSDPVRTLVLFRDVATLLAARGRGFAPASVNLGNVHAGPGRSAVSRSVFLSADEVALLQELERAGAVVAAQAIPQDAPVSVG
jgi:mannose/fructose/N-acetylgalactosamine-specific phosphotransferase system component IIB